MSNPVALSKLETNGWEPRSKDYPHLFLIDITWHAGVKPTVEPGSLIRDEPQYNDLSFAQAEYDTDFHGEKTLHIIKTIARQLSDERITLIGVERKNVNLESGSARLRLKNLPEALIYVQAMLNTGDVVVINAAPTNAEESFFDDGLIRLLLKAIVRLGGVVVLAAGNGNKPINSPKPSEGIVLVGGVDTTGKPQSNYGKAITCYGIVPYMLANKIIFGHSSAATAYIGGFVMMILNYARFNNITLMAADIPILLQKGSMYMPSQELRMVVPDWNAVCKLLKKRIW
ncbi:hypothetical protein GCM10028807_42070 [Spirosoma daeguense]